LVVVFALLASGCGGSAPPPPLPTGTWEVHGVTQVSSGAQDDWVGRTYDRSWIVYYGCRDRDCGLRLARQAADATEDAALIRHGYDYAATFTFRTSGCRTSRTGTLTKRFTAVVKNAGQRLQATERMAGTFPGCSLEPGQDGRIAGVTSWTATRSGAQCPPPEQDCQYRFETPVIPPPRAEQRGARMA
jgi:hypothetical protein